jgi:hypothetical protein|tara:strand:+ start:3593 stop:3871 length:279 start_codon:yes stop_codon:yes gene_type:complete
MTKYTFIKKVDNLVEKNMFELIDEYWERKWYERRESSDSDDWTVEEVQKEYEAYGVELCLFHCEDEETKWLQVFCVKEHNWDITKQKVWIEE